MPSRGYTFDAWLQLKDAGAITASAPAQVASTNKIIDVGQGGCWEGTLILDVDAIDVSNLDEGYSILLQGSSSPTFASDIENLAGVTLGGNNAAGRGGASNSVVGRRFIGVCNEVGDTLYRYLRLYTVCTGTTPSINYRAQLSPLAGH